MGNLLARPSARPEQRSAFLGGKAVAVDKHHVDIRRPYRYALRQQQGCFIDHGCERPPLNLFGGKRTSRDAFFSGDLVDHRIHLGIDGPAPRAIGIAVPAGAGLLAEAMSLAQTIEHLRETGLWITGWRKPLARAPGNIETAEVTDREWPHRQ